MTDMPDAAGAAASEADVLEFLDLAHELGVTVWLDGGWAVDACLGRQTRTHGDIDVVIQAGELDAVVSALRARGYGDVARDDTRQWNFVLGDDRGRQVDFHVVVIDENGDGIYGPVENGQRYPAAALAGTGSVGGRPVRCISPESLLAGQ